LLVSKAPDCAVFAFRAQGLDLLFRELLLGYRLVHAEGAAIAESAAAIEFFTDGLTYENLFCILDKQ